MEDKKEEKISFGWPRTEYTAFRTPHNAWGSRCPLIPKAKTEPEKKQPEKKPEESTKKE